MDRISTHKKSGLVNHFRSDGTARLISNLMNPLFMPPLVMGILAWLISGRTSTVSWIIGLSVVFYTLIPFTGVCYLLHTNRISSLDLPEREARKTLYKISIVSTVMASASFSWATPAEYQIFTISLIFPINALAGLIINEKWKISVHTAALSTAGTVFLFIPQIGTIFLDSGLQILSLFVLLLLLLLMAWARHRLNVHTLAELLGGAVSGFLLTLLQLTILINLW